MKGFLTLDCKRVTVTLSIGECYRVRQTPHIVAETFPRYNLPEMLKLWFFATIKPSSIWHVICIELTQKAICIYSSSFYLHSLNT